MGFEKYGAEIEKYDVIETVPFRPEEKKVAGKGLTMDEAMELKEKNENYTIVPAN